MKPNTKNDVWKFADIKSNLECWNWMGAKHRDGYGFFVVKGKNFYAHRVTYEVFNGVELNSSKIIICHHCDNPSCVNPQHLFAGTNAENSNDMKSKGRQARGEMVKTCKMTEEKVLDLRKRFQAGESYKSLSRFFGIRKTNCYKIVKGWYWKHLPLFP